MVLIIYKEGSDKYKNIKMKLLINIWKHKGKHLNITH